jgi:hypothetical protein
LPRNISGQEEAIKRHWQRLKQRGLRRIAVEVVDIDAQSLRQLAEMLCEDVENAERAGQQFAAMVASTGPNLRAMLTGAPPESIQIAGSCEHDACAGPAFPGA